MNTLMVTGSSGLIGSEVVAYFASRGWAVHGIDNNMRRDFFGPGGDTTANLERLKRDHDGFRHHAVDIRDREAVLQVVEQLRPDLLVHAAAQPSHDLAAQRPFDDFDVNAVGTMNLLEATRRHAPEAVFVFMSTNKVYGDRPNTLNLRELETRWEFADPEFRDGIAETFPIDQSLHSIFGASKVAADVMVQEYGRYFGLKTCCLRGGCLSGPNHAGVELHGFLSYLVKVNVTGGLYTVFGHQGKQVRDNIHSLDVARFIDRFQENPRPGEIYNIGGGRQNSCSIIEAFEMVESVSGKPMQWQYDERARKGDHICYISDLSKMREHYPGWDITVPLQEMIEQMCAVWTENAGV